MGLTTEILRRIWVGRRSTVSSNSDLPGAPQGHRNLETGFPSPTRRRPAPWPSQPQLGPEIRPVNGRPLGRPAVYRQLLPHQCRRTTLGRHRIKVRCCIRRAPLPRSRTARLPTGQTDQTGLAGLAELRTVHQKHQGTLRPGLLHHIACDCLPCRRYARGIARRCHRQDSSEGIDAPNIMSLIGS